MTLPTHTLFYLFLSNLLGVPLKVTSVIVGIIGTMLPDLSNPYGNIGKILKPVSDYISHKWGHRTITHSWIAVTFALGISLMAKLTFNDNSGWLFLLGVGSHILLDMGNISGVKFWYPEIDVVCVIPADEELRIGTGSVREKRLAVAFLILVIVTLPLGIWGYESVLRFLAGSHTAAVEEYKSMIDTNEVFVDVTSGINRITQEPVTNKRYKVVAAMPKKLTLVQTDTGKRITIGQIEDAIIETKRMRIHKGIQIHSEIIDIDAGREGWDRIAKELESPFSYAIGSLKLEERPDYRPEIDSWEGIDVYNTIVTLNYSGLDAINKLRAYKILEGKVKVRKELSEEGVLGPLRETVNELPVETLLVNTPLEGLRIVEGQKIGKGDIIARDPNVDRIQSEIIALQNSLITKDIEENRADSISQDKVLELNRQIASLQKTIDVQTKVATAAAGSFQEAEQARLEKFQHDLANLTKERDELLRSIQENKSYIVKRKDAMKKETEANIQAKYAQIAAATRRCPYSGTITKIKQRSPNVFEIEIQTNHAKANRI